MEVDFNRRALLWLGLLGGLCLIVGPAMAVDDWAMLGVPVPPVVRAVLGVLAVVLGAWFVYATVSRARSEDPAIRLAGDVLLLHANPGFRLELHRDEILEVGPVRPVASRVQRLILGGQKFEIATTRPEGLRASTVPICARFIDGDLPVFRDALAAWHDTRPSRTGQ